MPQNKNQHYVPKFYFKQFSKNGRSICTYCIPKNLPIEHAPINSQCSKDYFYNKNTKIEETFSMLEGLMKTKLKSIIENKSLNFLSKEEIEHLKSHILFQYGRTKSAKEKENEMANYLFDLFKPKIFADAKKAGKDINWNSIQNIKIERTSNYSLFISMVSGILLSDLNIIILENSSNIDFIFSDNPVVFFNSFFNKSYSYGTTGIASTGLQIFYPINSKYLLFLYDPEYYFILNNKIKLTKNEDIQRINGLQILNCNHNIYFENFKMKNKIIERYNQIKGKIPKQKNEFEIMGKRMNKDGTYKELLRTSSPKIYYNLKKLSFFKHKKNTKPFGIRNQYLFELNSKVTEAIEKGEIKLKK